MKNQTLQSRVLRCALVIIFVFACALCVSSAQAADNKLTLIENHVMVTKGGVEEPANSDEIYNTMSNYATITYDDEGNGTVKGLIGSIDGASYHTIVKMAGISDGSTIDITNECEILDASNAIVKIPAEYMKQFGEDGTRPVLYTVINGDTVSDSSLFYHEVYVSVNVDGEEIYLPDSRYAEDPNNPSLHQNYTINGHDNYRFMNVQGNYIKTGLGMGNTPQGPFNVNEIFGGDNSFLNYNIDKVEVYTVQDNETMFDTARVVDNANNQYFVLDSKTNQINGLDKLFCFRIAVRIEATTKTDIKTNIINPRLQDSMIDWHGIGDNEFTLMRVNGYEYSCDDGKTWQTNPHFTGLTAGTTYHVLQRPVGSTGHSKRHCPLQTTARHDGYQETHC